MNAIFAAVVGDGAGGECETVARTNAMLAVHFHDGSHRGFGIAAVFDMARDDGGWAQAKDEAAQARVAGDGELVRRITGLRSMAADRKIAIALDDESITARRHIEKAESAGLVRGGQSREQGRIKRREDDQCALQRSASEIAKNDATNLAELTRRGRQYPRYLGERQQRQ